MSKRRTIELDGIQFKGVPAVVVYLQKHYKHGTMQGLRRAIEHGASTYLGHSLILQRETEAPASTSEPEHRYLGRPPLLGIRH